MLHKFVAASQAQSRSWKTYMKINLYSPVAFFGANFASLVSYMPLAHADFKRVSPGSRTPGVSPQTGSLGLGKSPFFRGATARSPRRRVRGGLCINIHERGT